MAVPALYFLSRRGFGLFAGRGSQQSENAKKLHRELDRFAKRREYECPDGVHALRPSFSDYNPYQRFTTGESNPCVSFEVGASANPRYVYISITARDGISCNVSAQGDNGGYTEVLDKQTIANVRGVMDWLTVALQPYESKAKTIG